MSRPRRASSVRGPVRRPGRLPKALGSLLVALLVLAPVGCEQLEASALDVYLVTDGEPPGGLQVRELFLRHRLLRLEPCDTARQPSAVRQRGPGSAARRLAAVFAAPRARAHGAGSSSELTVGAREDVLAQRRARLLGTLLPPPGRYCAATLLVGSDDDGVSPSLEASLELDGEPYVARSTAARQLRFRFDPPLEVAPEGSRGALIIVRRLDRWFAGTAEVLESGPEAIARQLLTDAQEATSAELVQP